MERGEPPTLRSTLVAVTGDPLANPAWHALTGRQAHLAEVVGGARRFLPDVSFFAAVDRLDGAGWSALADLAGPGGAVVVARADVPAPPPGWVAHPPIRSHQMVAERLTPPTPDERAARAAVRPLTVASAGRALALVAAAQPGPFLARTIELGGFVGIEDDGRRLVAMAGERLRLGGHTEVGGVCTHPDARGRGLAAAVTRHVAAGILDRGEVPFLHVAHGNDPAVRLYERLGFTHRRTVDFVLLEAPE